jgi:hypothetical protein
MGITNKHTAVRLPPHIVKQVPNDNSVRCLCTNQGKQMLFISNHPLETKAELVTQTISNGDI